MLLPSLRGSDRGVRCVCVGDTDLMLLYFSSTSIDMVISFFLPVLSLVSLLATWEEVGCSRNGSSRNRFEAFMFLLAEWMN